MPHDDGLTVRFTAEELRVDPILQFFSYVHLPSPMQDVSRPFCVMAKKLVGDLPHNSERTVALRKLLESKDAAVRAFISMKREGE